MYGLLGKPRPPSEPEEARRLETARRIMLQTMSELELDTQHPVVFRHIFYAEDAQVLWYCRSELMTVLAAERGETFARERIADISKQFEGLLPKSFKYREPPR